MDIYVESRTKNADYYWVSQSTAPEKAHTVPSIIQSVTKFNGDKDLKLIHESEPSIVLLRSQGQLLLLVSGLRTKRQDKDRRYIRNSIAWVGEKTDEPILRQIAALVLENNFQILENLVVESSNRVVGELFQVNWQAIDQLIPPNVEVPMTLPEQQKNGKIARTSESRTQELANELREYELPGRDGALVAVTAGFKPTAIFARANVWRGLSNDTSLSSNWQSILTSPHPVHKPLTNPKTLPFGIKAVYLIIFLTLALAVSTYLIFASSSVTPPPQFLQSCFQAYPKFIYNRKVKDTTDTKVNTETTSSNELLPQKIFLLEDKYPQPPTIQLISKEDNQEKEIEPIVQSLQEILIAANQKLNLPIVNNLKPDGKLDFSIKEATFKFQNAKKELGVPQNGDVNYYTWKALKEETKDNKDTEKSWKNLENVIWKNLLIKTNNDQEDATQKLTEVCTASQN